MSKLMIPHDHKGNHVTWCYSDEFDKEIYEFKATLQYDGFERGRSALNIVWKDIKTNKLYRSGMKLLSEHLKEGGGHQIKGDFTFKKQGTSVLLTKKK